MSIKNSFESLVFQDSKPLMSGELNILQDLQGNTKNEILKSLCPSGFISSSGKGLFEFGTEPNTFKWVNRPLAHVNGWIVPLELTSTNVEGENVIELEPSPNDSTALPVDFVYLEVWRALIKPDPDTENKPGADKIFPQGNVLANDPSTWLEDDLTDTPVGIETSLRVQIQYAIRVARLVNNPTFRDGYLDVNVTAQGPNVAKTVIPFNPSNEDVGLWIAGGTGSEIPNTIDGYVYSIPIALVYRRNSAGFDMSNGNGGIVGVGTLTPSDRPDGLYSDQIVLEDVQDLRHAVSVHDINWNHVLDENVSLLLDNKLETWVGLIRDTGWIMGGQNSFGTKLLKADSIFSSTLDPLYTGGDRIRHPDNICTVFTDRPHTQYFSRETVVNSGNSVSVDLNPILTELPEGTTITDVIKVLVDGTEEAPFNISGLGSLAVNVAFENPKTGRVTVWYEITYPKGTGLTSQWAEDCSEFKWKVTNPQVMNTIQLDPAVPGTLAFTTDFTSSPNSLDQFLHVEFEQGSHREVSIQYHTEVARTVSVNVEDDGQRKYVILPEMPYMSDVDPNTDIIVTGSSIVSVEGFELTLDPSTPVGMVSVTFHPLRALPQGIIFTVFYKMPAIQAVPKDFLPSELKVEPVCISEFLYTGIASSGSSNTSFPYVAPLNQIPISHGVPVLEIEGERSFNAPGPVTINGFSADTGMLKLPTLVPVAYQNEIIFRNPVSLKVEGDNRGYIDHYRSVEGSVRAVAAFAQPLTSPSPHKVFLPMICRLKEDSQIGRAGTYVLVVLSHVHSLYSNQTEDNRITFDNTYSCASVYKIKDNWVNHYR